MAFVTSGKAALERMQQASFDVLVCDLRMPEMDGATLMEHVHRLHPETVRFVLSGYAELEMALRTVPVAHQFLSKPCDPVLLENLVARSLTLQTFLHEEKLLKVVGGVRRLPSAPGAYFELTRVIANEKSSAADVASVIKRDVAMCAKLLQLVNSSFVGIGRRISSVDQAVQFLGLNLVKNLVLSLHVFHMDRGTEELPGFSIEHAQRHAILTGTIGAKMVSEDPRLSEDAFMAGMLHDVGELVLIADAPREAASVMALAHRTSHPIWQAERDAFGVSHAELGGYLLGIWGLPYGIVEAVAFHHEPERVAQRGLDVLLVVHVADWLAHAVEDRLSALRAPVDDSEPAEIPARIQIPSEIRLYLEKLRLGARVPAWEDLAEAMVARTLDVEPGAAAA
jgi:HD-like signal output (HDOD) protein/CheY-like chemotaxis protein